MEKQEMVNTHILHEQGSLFINTMDNNGRIVAVTRFAVLRVGIDSHEVIEIRTETPNGKSEHKVEVNR